MKIFVRNFWSSLLRYLEGSSGGKPRGDVSEETLKRVFEKIYREILGRMGKVVVGV